MATRDPVVAGSADYTDVFTAVALDALSRSPQDWARLVLEGASLPMRVFLRVGWRWGLGFPLTGTDSILGWPVVAELPGQVTLAQQSWLFGVALLMCTTDGELSWTTSVTYRSRISPVVWGMVGPIHRRFAPRALRRAAC
ncbi:MAG TPA: hypothetical protein VG899_00660 [Mycobacteriales bacterium]|nr:hypothetical protein [Mycobacteriales bacterium]